MTLEEAIKHCEEVVEIQRSKAHMYYKDKMIFNRTINHNTEAEYYEELMNECIECAEEYQQFAEWLKALKEIWGSGDCNDCRNGQCEWKPKLGQLVRFNCPHYVGVENGEVNADENSN